MSDQKFTFQDFVEKWRGCADRSHVDVIVPEILSFVRQCTTRLENPLTMSEIQKRKSVILGIWCPTSWQEAKKANAHWTDEKRYNKRMAIMSKGFDEALKTVFADEIASFKDVKPVEKKPAAKVAPIVVPGDVKVTTLDEIRRLKAERMAQAGGNN